MSVNVIDARNVNDAFDKGVDLIRMQGREEETRAGPALVMPNPVITCYERPWERVLFNSTRDANPFFHLAEALWMLAGQQDATWLDKFVKDFSARFAEADGQMHGAYGYRWRTHFCDWADDRAMDQLDAAVHMLKKNPGDRRVVIQMWDPEWDLGQDKKDIPCNLTVLPRITDGKLDISVFCRSNDLIWGAYGANAVHFSVLQEYLASKIGVGIGTYYQISNNYHAYKAVLAQQTLFFAPNPYATGWCNWTPIVTEPDAFDIDLALFMTGQGGAIYQNPFFDQVAEPLMEAHALWKSGDRQAAVRQLEALPPLSDWKVAAYEWMMRRLAKMENVVDARPAEAD